MGYVEDNTYFTVRYAIRSQVFSTKKYFGGKQMQTPLGMQCSIAKHLHKKGIVFVQFKIVRENHTTELYNVPLQDVLQSVSEVVDEQSGEQFFIDGTKYAGKKAVVQEVL